MSIDSRLRQGLERSANSATADLVDDLPHALKRGRRRKRVLIVARAATVAAALAIVTLVGPSLLSSLRTDQPAGTPSPSITPTGYSAIAGTYTVELSNADATVAANQMTGTWTMQLAPDGAMSLTIPAGFTRESQAPAGSAFTLAESRFRTNLFYGDICHSVGVYRWQLRGAKLVFTALNEDCAVRRAIFASQPWDSRP